MRRWLAEHVGVVRIRQLAEELTHRLAFLPTVMMLFAVAVSQLTLWIDRRLGEIDVPEPLATNVASSRAIFAAIAGALITAVTLLLSMMLIAVQLASGQFSPRTLRNWLGDVTLRRSTGVVLGTTVFCLMGLRSVRDAAQGGVLPTVTVLIAVLLGVGSLIAVIIAVDHVTRNLQVGSVADRLVDETIRMIRTTGGERASELPSKTPVVPVDADASDGPPAGALAIEAEGSGWVQQVDEAGIVKALPEHAVAWIVVVHGAYVTSHSPLVLVAPEDDHTNDHSGGDRASHRAPRLDDDVIEAVRRSIALGQNRTMQQDVGFGLGQLTDIAVRALSPGVNDPQTATDIIAHLGEVLGEIWSHPRADQVVRTDGRTLHRRVASHEEQLRAALDPIRHHGRSDPVVLTALVRMLQQLRSETARRGLPGPVAPIDAFVAETVGTADDEDWLDRERADLRRWAASASV